MDTPHLLARLHSRTRVPARAGPATKNAAGAFGPLRRAGLVSPYSLTQNWSGGLGNTSRPLISSMT